MLAHHQIGFGDADIGRAHDFKGFGVFQHAVLMDARLVQKRVLADNRLVELHRKARDGGHQAAGPDDLGGINAGLIGHDVVAHPQRHHHLFQRGVARPFAQAVDGAFDLPRPRRDRRQSVGGRHAEIVVAMGGKDHAIRPRHLRQQHGDQSGAFGRGGIAHRVGDIDGGRPGLDRGFHRAAQIVMLGPCGIHRRPLHIVAQIAGMGHGVVNAHHHLIHRQFGDVAVGGGGADKGVDARAAGVFHRLPAAVDILVIGPRKAADHG